VWGGPGAWSGAILLCTPLPLLGQAITITGRILHGGLDHRPVTRQWAVIHELRPEGGGAVDSTRTDRGGRYRLRLARVDTGALYLVGTTYQDVGYFSPPLRVEPWGRTEAAPLVVYDTSSAGPALQLERRLLMLFRSRGRGRPVREVIAISNPGDHARIASDSLHPVWTLLLPSGVTGWEVREGDISPETMWLVGDTIKIFAPIWPGPPRQASYEYALAGSSVRIPVDQWTGGLGILVEDTTAVVSGAPFDTLGVQQLEGRRFAAYRTGPLRAGSRLSVKLSSDLLDVERLLPFVVGVTALVLACGLWVALRRKRTA
jgi:hypothetical protein